VNNIVVQNSNLRQLRLKMRSPSPVHTWVKPASRTNWACSALWYTMKISEDLAPSACRRF
jgi:hypothetical protein